MSDQKEHRGRIRASNLFKYKYESEESRKKNLSAQEIKMEKTSTFILKYIIKSINTAHVSKDMRIKPLGPFSYPFQTRPITVNGEQNPDLNMKMKNKWGKCQV